MKFVSPIRDKSKIKEIRDWLEARSKRDWFLFSLGISTGLRISDLRVLKVSDVEDKTHITIKEQKTKKRKKILLNESVRKMISEYIKDMSENEYLFKSRQGNKPLGRNQCGNIISEAGRQVGIENLGTHSMRKSFGYWHYKEFKNIAILMTIFNHSSQKVTMKYLGIEQDEMDATLDSFNLLA
jgi:integrase